MQKKHKIRLTVALCLCAAVLVCAVGVPAVHYHTGLRALRQEDYSKAYRALAAAGKFADAEEQLLASKYTRAQAYIEQKDYRAAVALLVECATYKNAAQLMAEIYPYTGYQNTFGGGEGHAVAVTNQGKLVVAGKLSGYGDADPAQNFKPVDRTGNWGNLIAVAAGENFTLALQGDGQVKLAGVYVADANYHARWENVVAIAAGRNHALGLRADGTLRFFGDNDHGQCAKDMLYWKNIVAIAAGANMSLALQSDGRVKLVGQSDSPAPIDVSDWRNITDIAVGYGHILGITQERKVVATGENFSGQCDLGDWNDIVDVAAGQFHTVGLRADGRVLAAGENHWGQCDVADWQNIVAIAAGESFTLGLQADGKVLFTGKNHHGQGDAQNRDNLQINRTASK